MPIAGAPIQIVEGTQVEDWLYVSDFSAAVATILASGAPGETYPVGARDERTRDSVVDSICSYLDEYAPLQGKHSYRAQITHVTSIVPTKSQKLLAMDPMKIETLGWKKNVSFDEGIKKTIEWYFENQNWVYERS